MGGHRDGVRPEQRRRGHAGAAGVGQTQRARDLVVGLARGVVHGAAQDFIAAPVLDQYNVAVPAAGDEAQKRRLQILMR